MDADAAERLHHLIVARALYEDRRRNVRASGGVDVGSAVDTVIVEDDDADREAIPADRLHFHAAEAEGAVALDREHGFAGLYRCRDRKARADTHDAPGADVQAFARLVDGEDATGEGDGVGAF